MTKNKTNQIMDLYYYTIFGLNISSELELNMLNLITKPASIDVTIVFGTTPKQLNEPLDRRVQYEAKEGEFLMWFTFSTVRFYVQQGKRITIETGGSEDWDFIKVFLLAPVTLFKQLFFSSFFK